MLRTTRSLSALTSEISRASHRVPARVPLRRSTISWLDSSIYGFPLYVRCFCSSGAGTITIPCKAGNASVGQNRRSAAKRAVPPVKWHEEGTAPRVRLRSAPRRRAARPQLSCRRFVHHYILFLATCRTAEKEVSDV